ncbi:hypothetical protein AHAS_Ahas03G0226800 [Arachis hypogaea]
MIRDDAHAPFWKERFVAALPKLFSEKVLQKLQTQFGTQIPYNSLPKYHSGIWNQAQKNYPTVKKEILAIVLCVSKFQKDLFNKTFLIRTDSILSCFDFTIEHIKGELNSFPDFLT